MVKKWEREKKKQERIIQSLATTNLELGREIKRLTKENKMKLVTNQEGGSDSPKKKFKGEKEDEKKSSSNEREMRIEMGKGGIKEEQDTESRRRKSKQEYYENIATKIKKEDIDNEGEGERSNT